MLAHLATFPSWATSLRNWDFAGGSVLLARVSEHAKEGWR